ncbi:phosphotransacetylase [Fontibacillus solani]|uniref:Phosphotransacetylase n=1 Tax=Fontibacillus solani TaxID=1572857 RepID=A0A7W3SW33_9BACL|nr:HAD domain-containing protein [Fontibacillus solani]MBA9087292.1 phosphotransacetylase [Fontibacillus solani]
MKIIFLDIDGVIVTSRHFIQSKQYFGLEFDPVCAYFLKDILKRTDAQIVVSSSWREGRTLKQIQSIFESNGINEVIGITPVLEEENREQEIQEFINSVGNVECFVIIDDEEEMNQLKTHLISTDFRTGITEEIVEEVVARLI